MAKGSEGESLNVALGFVADAKVDTEFLTSLLNVVAQRQDQIQGRVITTQGFAGRLDIGRSIVATAFLERTDADYLVMVDSDMVFDVKHYDELVRGSKRGGGSITSGLYARNDGSLCVFDLTDEGYRITDPTKLMAVTRYYEAGAVGMGFICIPRRVLVKMQEAMPDHPLPWFENGAEGPGRLADDTSFCWRASEVDEQVYVDVTIQVGHLKTVAMFPKIESQLVKPGLVVP